MTDFVSHPLFHRICVRLLNQKGGAAIAANPDALEFFKQGLPTLADPTPPTPAPAHPILDWIAKEIQWVIANPQAFAAFVAMIIQLFGL